MGMQKTLDFGIFYFCIQPRNVYEIERQLGIGFLYSIAILKLKILCHRWKTYVIYGKLSTR